MRNPIIVEFLSTMLPIFLFAGLILWGIGAGMRHEIENNKVQYEECKAHTTDLEWCFKQFQPNLN